MFSYSNVCNSQFYLWNLYFSCYSFLDEDVVDSRSYPPHHPPLPSLNISLSVFHHHYQTNQDVNVRRKKDNDQQCPEYHHHPYICLQRWICIPKYSSDCAHDSPRWQNVKDRRSFGVASVNRGHPRNQDNVSPMRRNLTSRFQLWQYSPVPWFIPGMVYPLLILPAWAEGR